MHMCLFATKKRKGDTVQYVDASERTLGEIQGCVIVIKFRMERNLEFQPKVNLLDSESRYDILKYSNSIPLVLAPSNNRWL